MSIARDKDTSVSPASDRGVFIARSIFRSTVAHANDGRQLIADTILIPVPPIWTAGRNGIAIEPTAAAAVVAIVIVAREEAEGDETAVVETVVKVDEMAVAKISVHKDTAARPNKGPATARTSKSKATTRSNGKAPAPPNAWPQSRDHQIRHH